LDLLPEITAQLERIAAAGIRFLPTPQLAHHFVFERDGFVLLVENKAGRFGSVGSPGLLTERGFAPLVEKNGRKVFVSKDYEREATPEEAQRINKFFTDLKAVLS